MDRPGPAAFHHKRLSIQKTGIDNAVAIFLTACGWGDAINRI